MSNKFYNNIFFKKLVMFDSKPHFASPSFARVLLDKMDVPDLPAPLDPEASLETSASLDPRDLV